MANAKSKALKADKGISLKRQKEHDNLRNKAIADNWMKKLKNE